MHERVIARVGGWLRGEEAGGRVSAASGIFMREEPGVVQASASKAAMVSWHAS
jgi:hypothetical protein